MATSPTQLTLKKLQKEIAGQPVVVIKSTSSLNTEEFSEYNRNVERFAHEYGFKFNNDIPQY